MMVHDLRDSYDQISTDYLQKKAFPWIDFKTFYQTINWTKVRTVIDIGGGNGRNLISLKADYHILMDLSIELLQGYCGPDQGDRVAGALPQLPFRSNSASHSLCLAVIHHFREREEAIRALTDIHRITQQRSILSVWRRWRKGYREKIFNTMKKGQPTGPLINHNRPWKNSKGGIMTTRFYHYYTFKELYWELKHAGFHILTYNFLGGRHGDANIFVEIG